MFKSLGIEPSRTSDESFTLKATKKATKIVGLPHPLRGIWDFRKKP